MRNTTEAKLEQKTQAFNKQAGQMKQIEQRMYKLEKMLNEYKEGIASLEGNDSLN